MRKSWTDERLDHFAERVDERFDVVDRRFDEADRRFDKFEIELHRINGRLDWLSKAIAFGAVTLAGAMLAGFAAMTTLLATQL